MEIGNGFKDEELSPQTLSELKEVATKVRGDILRMSQVAKSGPVGGSLSIVEALLVVIAGADLDPADCDNIKSDKLIVTHDHATSTLYAVLGRMDFFDLDDAVGLYRKAGSIFQGRPERAIPSVLWGGLSSGQGISAACGLSLAARWRSQKPNIFVVMSDEEQQRGEIAEARRFAKKYRLNNITAIIDANNVQSAGKTAEIMPQNIKYEYIADGWDVIEINGHEPAEIYQAVRRASQIQSTPVLVIANTVMGSGISMMENQPEYYARPITDDEYEESMRELGEPFDLEEALDYRVAFGDFDFEYISEEPLTPKVIPGEARDYPLGSVVNNITAFGEALVDLGAANKEAEEGVMAVFDCAHTTSTGVASFAAKNHDRFLQAGLSNKAATTIAAAMSVEGVSPLLVDLGVHSIGEVYGQLRQADLNSAGIKVLATSLGLDAGGEGKAIQCIDYVGIIANLFGFGLILPADANETDRALRFAMTRPGNWVIGLGKSDMPVISGEDGKPLFGGSHEFKYDGVVKVRSGENGVILSMGHMLSRALKVWDKLNEAGMAPDLLHVPSPLLVDRIEDDLLQKSLRKGRVVTIEDHNLNTGLGARIANVIARKGISCRLLTLGVDSYSLSGDPEELYKLSGLDVDTITTKSTRFLKRR